MKSGPVLEGRPHMKGFIVTAQYPEILMYRGQTHNLCEELLRPYLARLRRRDRPVFGWPGSACHRGYVGTWEFRGDHLCLVGLDARLRIGDQEINADLARTMPWVNGCLHATWVNGLLRCPEGRLVTYVHNMYASIHERDRWFKIERGQLVGEYVTLNPPERIIYRIEPDGRRTCVDDLRQESEIPDPLEGREFSDAHLAWGLPPVADDGEEAEEGYLIAAEFITGTGLQANVRR